MATMRRMTLDGEFFTVAAEDGKFVRAQYEAYHSVLTDHILERQNFRLHLKEYVRCHVLFGDRRQRVIWH